MAGGDAAGGDMTGGGRAKDPDALWNPYVAGVALGLVLLAAFVLTGRGLGASGFSYRIGAAAVQAVAPGHAADVPLLAAVTASGSPLDSWIVYEVLGVVLGGALGAWTSGRLRSETLRGPTFSQGSRLALAVGGGVLMGVGARMARGCASGQALSGGALLGAGAWAFMLCFFGGGYAVAYFVRRQWK
jgi:hypothetical protein